jgi:hypothetical protein
MGRGGCGNAAATPAGGSALPGGAAARPLRDALPLAVRAADVSTILFVRRSGELAFQSRLHARAWPLARGAYAASADELR